MKKNALMLWAISAAAAVVFVSFTYSRTFPEAALDLKVSRQEAADLAREFLQRQGFDVSGYRHAQSFRTSSDTRSFLEKKLDLAEANRLMSGDVSVWKWQNRWFKPLEQEEHWVSIAPDGRLVAWTRVIPEDAPGERVEAPEAQRIAAEWLAANKISLEGYEIADSEFEELPNRRDHDVIWKLSSFDCHDATQRIWVHVAGNSVTQFYNYLKLPDTWPIEQNRAWAYKSLLQQIASVAHGCLGLATFVLLAIALRRGGLRLKFIWVFALPLAFLPLLLFLNNMSLSWMAYETTNTLDSFWAKQFASLIVGIIGTFVSVAILLLAADWLARAVWPQQLPLSLAHTRAFWRSRPVGTAVFVGLCLAALHLAYVSAFYFAARWIGAWLPQDTPAINALGTPMPWLMPLHTGLTAAIDEELTFRLFALALFARLTKRLWPGLIISALIWAFLHSTYPQEPFFIRGIELTVVGLVYGIIALRYGIVATIVSHYTYNAVSSGIALTATGDAYLVITGLAAMGLAALLLLPALWPRREGQPLPVVNAPPPPQDTASPAQPAPLDMHSFHPYEPMPARSMRILAVIAVLGAVASFLLPRASRFGDYVRLEINKPQASQIADDYLRNKDVNPEDYTRSVDFSDNLNGSGAQYVWEITKSLHSMNQIFQVYQPDSVFWEVWYFKPLQREGHNVYLAPDGGICGYKHTVEPDAPGPKLPQDEAKTLAEQHLRQQYGVNLDQYRLVEADSTDMAARTDHEFTWEHSAAKTGECGFRVSASVLGDEAHSAVWFFHLPEKWLRGRDRESTVRILLSLVLFPLPILFFWRCFVLYAKRKTAPFRVVLLVAAVPAAASLVMAVLNLETLWSGYDVDVSPAVYLATQALYQFGMGVVMFWLLAAFMIMAADSFYRDAFPRQIPPLCWFGLGQWQFKDDHGIQIPRLPMGLVWGEAMAAGVLLIFVFPIDPEWVDIGVRALGCGTRPEADITAGYLTSWPALTAIAEAFPETATIGLFMVLLVSIVRRYFWHRIWLVAFCLLCIGTRVSNVEFMNDAFHPKVLITGLFLYLAAKFVLRGNMATVVIFILAACVQGEAVDMLVVPNPHVRLNGLLLCIPLALCLIAGVVLYARGMAKEAARKAAIEHVAAADLPQAG